MKKVDLVLYTDGSSMEEWEGLAGYAMVPDSESGGGRCTSSRMVN